MVQTQSDDLRAVAKWRFGMDFLSQSEVGFEFRIDRGYNPPILIIINQY